MAVTIEYTGNPVFPWRVSSECATKAETFAKAARIEEVVPEAFQPVSLVAAMTEASQLRGEYGDQHHATEAPMPPHVAEVIAAAEEGDEEPGALKAGEAYREHG